MAQLRHPSFSGSLWAFLVCLACSHPIAAHEQTQRVGQVHFPVSCVEEAQRGLEYALAMLHSFWFPQSINAFVDLAKAQPDCAIVYWGVAISQRSNPLAGSPPAENLRRGWDAIERAKKLEAKTQRERDYICAMSAYYQDWEKTEDRSRILAYEEAMEKLAQRYPEDVEAAVLYALSLNEAITVLPADPTYSRQLKAARILEDVLRKQPEHPGALHYLIHSYDFPALAEKGLEAAKRYAFAAPDAPHARHMPSHTYSMLGMWEESIESNEAAVAIAKNYVHAIDFMVYAHLQMAHDAKAKALVDSSATLRKTTPNSAQRTPTGSLLTVYTAHAAIPARYAIERGAWAEAADLEVHNTSPVGDAITHFARAMGFARMGMRDGAHQEIDALRALRKELIQSKQDYWAEQIDIQQKAATAWVSLMEGDKAQAIALMRSAADMEDASEKSVAMENRLWPMRELLGELLLELDQPTLALREFEASLAISRNRLRGLHGAARAATQSGDRAKASTFYERIVTLTRDAESNRQEVAEARNFLLTHREGVNR